MELKHSPAPWRYCTEGNLSGDGLNHVIYDAEGVLIQSSEDYYPSVSDNEADWPLMAAAPELLAALIGLRASFSEYVGPNMSAADSAIAKAIGSKA